MKVSNAPQIFTALKKRLLKILAICPSVATYSGCCPVFKLDEMDLNRVKIPRAALRKYNSHAIIAVRII